MFIGIPVTNTLLLVCLVASFLFCSSCLFCFLSYPFVLANELRLGLPATLAFRICTTSVFVVFSVVAVVVYPCIRSSPLTGFSYVVLVYLCFVVLQ